MKRNIFVSKSNTKKQKLLYLILIGLAVIAFIFGILFIFIISEDNKIFIKENLLNYFSNISSSIDLFFKYLFNNYFYLIIIWILGISIIGVPIILLMFLFKSFLLGFSISSIISSFGTKGFVLSFIEVFPHKIVFLVVLLLIVFYSLSFSFKLFRFLFLKRNINFKECFNKYLKILLFSLIITLFISIYDGFVVNYLVNFFY